MLPLRKGKLLQLLTSLVILFLVNHYCHHLKMAYLMENDSFTKNKLELTSYKQQPLDCIITYVMS